MDRDGATWQVGTVVGTFSVVASARPAQSTQVARMASGSWAVALLLALSVLAEAASGQTVFLCADGGVVLVNGTGIVAISLDQKAPQVNCQWVISAAGLRPQLQFLDVDGDPGLSYACAHRPMHASFMR